MARSLARARLTHRCGLPSCARRRLIGGEWGPPPVWCNSRSLSDGVTDSNPLRGSGFAFPPETPPDLGGSVAPTFLEEGPMNTLVFTPDADKPRQSLVSI